MAEQKKRGFGALEQRIHEMEEEDARREQATSGQRDERERAPRTQPTGERDDQKR
jgi:hypothetical protein